MKNRLTQRYQTHSEIQEIRVYAGALLIQAGRLVHLAEEVSEFCNKGE
jgi:hypothetical protein